MVRCTVQQPNKYRKAGQVGLYTVLRIRIMPVGERSIGVYVGLSRETGNIRLPLLIIFYRSYNLTLITYVKVLDEIL